MAAVVPNLMLAIIAGWAAGHRSEGGDGHVLLIALAVLSVSLFALSCYAWRRKLTVLSVFAAAPQVAPWVMLIAFPVIGMMK